MTIQSTYFETPWLVEIDCPGDGLKPKAKLGGFLLQPAGAVVLPLPPFAR